MPVLELFTDSGATRIHELGRGETTIGRHRRCDVIFDDSSVSRKHARLTVDDTRVWLEDLGSRNGTLVNGTRIEGRYALSDGDRIRIERHRLTYHETNPHVVVDRPSSVTGTLNFKAAVVGHGQSRLREKLDAIMTISSHLSRSIDLDDLLGSLLETLLVVFQSADCGAILLPDHDDHPAVRTWRSRTDDSQSLRFMASRTVAQRVLDSGESLLCMDAASDAELATQQSIVDSQIRSVMCAPMPGSDGVVRGVIHLDRRDFADPFTMDDLELLACAAAIAGQAIENSQLHEERLKAELQEQELQLAGDVQRLLLPPSTLVIPGYELANHYAPAAELGGDYFDYVRMTDGRVAIAIADVAGKGPSAALLVASLSSALRAALDDGLECAATMERTARTLQNISSTGRFITMLLAILDPSSGELTMTSAGHVPPVIRRGNQSHDPIEDSAGCPVGITAGEKFQEVKWQMERGDVLLLMTDGVTESRNRSQELFGQARSIQAVLQSNGTARGTVDTVLKTVRQFSGDQRSSDDMCIVCLTRQ